MRVEHLRILRIDLAMLLLERCVLDAIFLRGIALAQRFAGAHAGAHPMEGREAVVSIPGFIPEKDDVRFDREHFFHEALHIVNVTVKSAVGKQKHADPIEPSFGF